MENTTENKGLLQRNFDSFIEAMERGESWVQQPSKEPSYVKNAITGKAITGYNGLVLQQEMKEQGIENKTVITKNQMDGNNESGKIYWNQKGNNAYITTLTYDNPNAFYGKNSPEVINGEANAGDKKVLANGKEMRGVNFSMVFDASKVEEMVRQPKLNENGEPMKYKNNVVATYESGKPKRYDHDGSYVTKNGREITYKKGDFVYLHKAGSTIYETVPTGNKLEATKVNEPIKAEGLGKIPEARDNTPQEVLRNGLAKAFRGALTGDFEGWKPSKEQISSIKEYFKDRPGEFRGIARTAEQIARGSQETIDRISSAIESKQLAKVAEKTNVKEKSAGRK